MNNLDNEEKRNIFNYFKIFKNLYYAPELCKNIYTDKILNDNLDFLNKNKVITNNDILILNDLMRICYKQSINDITIKEYCDSIINLEKIWKRYYFKDKTSVSDITSIVINISVASANWWLEHPSEYEYQI